jgi:hypothetical protein
MTNEAKPDPEKREAPGGQGEIATDPHHSRADARLIRRAIRLRWPTKKSVRNKAIQRLEAMLNDDDGRVVVAAAKALIDADKVNLEQSERESPTPQIHEHRLELDERRSELLGIVFAIRKRAGIGQDSASSNGHATSQIPPHPHGQANGVPEPDV